MLYPLKFSLIKVYKRSFQINANQTYGEPPAEDIVWSQPNGKTLTESPGNGTFIDNTKPYMSFLEKEAVTRKDEGPVICTAANMHGKSR